ncbi:MAG: putative reverse transcriptase, partial [Streblomastix strix]
SSNCQVASLNFSIGGRLIYFLPAWQRFGADNLIKRDIKACLIHQECPSILQSNRYIPIENRSEASMTALNQLINKKLEEKIIIEVQEKDLSRINPCFAILKPGTNMWRKIIGCSILNKFLLSSHFIMEDFNTLRELRQKGDWMFKIDLHSAFHYIPVDPQFQPFLGFTHKEKFYKYVVMCLGVKHAPLRFNKVFLLVIGIIKEHMGIRVVAYWDDAIFLDQNIEELMNKQPLILKILEEFGWKISEGKSNLQIAQEVEFLNQITKSNQDQIQTTLERRAQMLKKCIMQKNIVQRKA